MNIWKTKWIKNEGKPKNLNENVWEQLKAYWQSEATKKTSEKNSKNRNSHKDTRGGATHNSGAMSFPMRERQMTIANDGVRPDYIELMEVTHTNKLTGQIQDPFAKEVIETLKKKKTERLTQLSQDGSETSSNEFTREEINKLVLEETPRSKGRLFGLGSIPDYDGSSSSSASQNTPRLLQEIDYLKNVVQEERTRRELFEQQVQDFFSARFPDFPGFPASQPPPPPPQ